MSTTVTYKGSVIATVSNAVKKLLTKGKYLEDDITITDSGGGGSANLETLQVSYTPSETAISDTQTPSQGYDGFDEAQISVAAIPSSYVGSGVSRQAAQTIHPSTSDQTIAADKYLSGAQTIKAVVLANLLAENIKSGVTVKVGDDTDDDCVTAVTGTYEGSGGDPNENLAKLISGTLETVNCNATAVNAGLKNNTYIKHVNLPLCTTLTQDCFYGDTKLLDAVFPSLTTVPSSGRCFYNCNKMTIIDLGSPNRICGSMFQSCSSLATIVLRKTSVVTLQNVNAFTGTKFASGGAGGTIYIPKTLYDALGTGTNDYKAASNWSTVNGYGTITWQKIEGSYYETHYADGTLIS